MAPRFVERINRQKEASERLYGKPQFDPPPYVHSIASRPVSSTSTVTTRDSISSAAPTSPTSSCTTNSSVYSLPSYQQATGVCNYNETPCIPRGSLILVTAANSWHGMHIVEQLLQQHYRVRGAVRDAEKAIDTTKYFVNKYGEECFEAFIVPDMAIPGAYNAAVRGCSGLIHAAAVRTMSANPYEVIPQTIIGALNALEAAAKEPRMRRFVHCSAASAARDSSSSGQSPVTSATWNMSSFSTAWERPPYMPDRAQAVLASATMQAEQTVWKWYHERRPNFILNCVLPDILWGEFLLPRHATTSLSGHILTNMLRPQLSAPISTPAHHSTDVQDSAIVHVAALILPGVMNERLFVTAQPCDIDVVTGTLLGQGHNSTMIHQELDRTQYHEAHRAEELLLRMRKSGWTSLDTSIKRAYEHFSVCMREV